MVQDFLGRVIRRLPLPPVRGQHNGAVGANAQRARTWKMVCLAHASEQVLVSRADEALYFGLSVGNDRTYDFPEGFPVICQVFTITTREGKIHVVNVECSMQKLEEGLALDIVIAAVRRCLVKRLLPACTALLLQSFELLAFDLVPLWRLPVKASRRRLKAATTATAT